MHAYIIVHITMETRNLMYVYASVYEGMSERVVMIISEFELECDR